MITTQHIHYVIKRTNLKDFNIDLKLSKFIELGLLKNLPWGKSYTGQQNGPHLSTLETVFMTVLPF